MQHKHELKNVYFIYNISSMFARHNGGVIS